MTVLTEVKVPELPWNDQQRAAIAQIIEHVRLRLKKPFLLQGYAGTGKTSLVSSVIRRVADELGISVSRIALIAPTNRAAKVLSNKTGLHTRTVHSLIYSVTREELDYQRERLHMWEEAKNFTELADLVIESNEVDLVELFENEMAALEEDDPKRTDPEFYREWLDAHRVLTLSYEGITLPDDPGERLALFDTMRRDKMGHHKREIAELLSQDLKLRKREPEEIISKLDLIIGDEWSMVGAKIGDDVVSYGVPCIFVGDPFQLKPVKAKAYWDGMRPDVVLTKIERQKGPGAGIPLAGQAIRTGGRVVANESLGLHRQGSLPNEYFLSTDQIIVGTHKTRERICRVVRRLMGHDSDFPQPGEKVVAVYNDKMNGIMNGELYKVLSCAPVRDGVVKMNLEDPYGKKIEGITAWVKGFAGKKATDFLPDFHGKFWWGYAITCHQSQGSEWKNTIVCDEWPGDGHDRWLYTAITRASLKCELIQ